LALVTPRPASTGPGPARRWSAARRPERPAAPAHRSTDASRGPWATRALDAVGDWLVERGMTVAATESTPTSREPICYCLEEVVEV